MNLFIILLVVIIMLFLSSILLYVFYKPNIKIPPSPELYKTTKTLNPKMVYKLQLSAIPSISSKSADAIIEKYPSFKNLYESLNSLSEDQITTISSLSGVQEFPMRIKCATMAWHTLLSALEKKV